MQSQKPISYVFNSINCIGEIGIAFQHLTFPLSNKNWGQSQVSGVIAGEARHTRNNQAFFFEIATLPLVIQNDTLVSNIITKSVT